MRTTACWLPWITACRLISSWRTMLSGRSCANPVTGMIPALLTSTSIGPSRRSTSSRNSVKPGRSVTSSGSPTASPPSDSATRTAAGSSRSPTATRAPSAASARAMASPIPRPPPVITATLPERERGWLAMD
jgi:hypothetical protein